MQLAKYMENNSRQHMASGFQREYRKCELCGKNRKAEVRASRSANGKKCAGNLTVNEPVEQSTVPENVALFTCDDVRLPVFSVRPSSCCRRKRDDVRYMRSPPMGSQWEPLGSH